MSWMYKCVELSKLKLDRSSHIRITYYNAQLIDDCLAMSNITLMIIGDI